jgi:hypothetical protein
MAEELDIEAFFPSEEGIAADEVLDASTEGIESDLIDEDVEVTEAAPDPIGRTWAFDFSERKFQTSGQAPTAIRGEVAVVGWVEKCLHTAEGAATVHPPGYGLPRPIADYIGEDPYDLEEVETDIEEALTFHPAIKSVEEIEIGFGETEQGDQAAEVSFIIVLDDGSQVDFETSIETDL